MGKCSKIRHIVRLREMLRRWRTRAAYSSSRAVPPDVPEGHVVVFVGISSRRFVIRAAHLNHPVFRDLLVRAEEEYGFAHAGPIAIPCDESAFEEILRRISSSSSRSVNLEELQNPRFCCHVGHRRACHAESLPLLRGFIEKSVW